MVGITILLPNGGAVGNVFRVAADGSWVVWWDPGLDRSLVPGGRATATASCLDVGVTGIPLADYRPHAIKLT